MNLIKVEQYRIVAAMLQVTFGDLKQRDKERRNKRLMSLSLIAAAILLVFGIFMFNAYAQADSARREAVQNSSAMLMNRAYQSLDQGDRLKAILIWDSENFELVQSLQIEGILQFISFSDDNQKLYVAFSNNEENVLMAYQIADKSETLRMSLPHGMRQLILNPLLEQAYVLFQDPEASVSCSAFDLISARKLYDFPNPERTENDVLPQLHEKYQRMQLSPDGLNLLLHNGSAIRLFELQNSKQGFMIPVENCESMLFTEEGRYFYTLGREVSLIDGRGKQVLRFHQATDGRELKRISLPGEVYKMFLGKEKRLFLSLTDGSLLRLEDNQVLEAAIPLSESPLDELYVSDDGRYLAALLRKEQVIKVLAEDDRNMGEPIPAQLLAFSGNRRFALYYSDSEYQIRDHNNNRLIAKLPDPNRRSDVFFQDFSKDTQNYRYAISNTGEYFAGLKALRSRILIFFSCRMY